MSMNKIECIVDNISIHGWVVLNDLGEGSFSQVKRVKHKKTGRMGAMKVFDLEQLANISPRYATVEKAEELVVREINILHQLSHDHIVELLDVQCEGNLIYLIMELGEGGELFDYTCAHKRLSEKKARHFFRQLISVVEYCHGNFIVHRDLKLENILLDKSQENIKVADFGFGNFMQPGKLMMSSCGSYQYVAPEVIKNKGYVGPSSDIWSMGVILYAMIHGYFPFRHHNVELYHSLEPIMDHDFTVNSSYISLSGSDLISKLLHPDPFKRITIQKLRLHDWVNVGYISAPRCTLPEYKSVNVVDPDIIAKLCYFGFKPLDIVEKLNSGARCQEVAMYHLLAEKKSDKERDKLLSSVSSSSSSSSNSNLCYTSSFRKRSLTTGSRVETDKVSVPTLQPIRKARDRSVSNNEIENVAQEKKEKKSISSQLSHFLKLSLKHVKNHSKPTPQTKCECFYCMSDS